MDCRGGNDADIEACEISYKAAEDVASLYGCEDRWDNYVLCMEEELRCSDRKWTEDNDCDNERNAYSDCIR
jgi:hypothetical protein